MENLEALALTKAVVIGVWLTTLFVLERVLPATPWPASGGWLSLRRVARNAGLFLLNFGLSPLVVIPVSVWAASWVAWRPEAWSGGWAIALDILILDLWIYWWHRANHEIQALWRFHEVHHLDGFLDTSTAVRFHFGEVLLSAMVRVPVIVAFDIPLVSILVFETLVMVSALFHHSNLRVPHRLEQVLSWVVITPGIHWIHHHAIRCDTDSNYGAIFSFWDPLFGSRSQTERTADMPIGVERERERPLPALLVRPFRRSIAGD